MLLTQCDLTSLWTQCLVKVYIRLHWHATESFSLFFDIEETRACVSRRRFCPDQQMETVRTLTSLYMQ